MVLVVGYGVIAGFGLGPAYIVPIAMLQKWFPDKRALITGLTVAGFGFGAVIAAPVAHRLIAARQGDPAAALLPPRSAYLVLCVVGAAFSRNPCGLPRAGLGSGDAEARVGGYQATVL